MKALDLAVAVLCGAYVSLLGSSAVIVAAELTPAEATDSIARARRSYDRVRAELEARRSALASRLAAASGAERGEVLEAARQAVLEALTAGIFPAWQGTEWAFSGSSDRPGEGQIACGVFVGTVLQHAGFRLDRRAMGRLASEHIALSLTGEKNLRRWSDVPVTEVVSEIEAWGPGLYAAGLDHHAGLIWVDGERRAHFVHSSYVGTSAVITEPLGGDNPFSWSRYRVVAKLLDDEMIERWLRGETFEAKKVKRRRQG